MREKDREDAMSLIPHLHWRIVAPKLSYLVVYCAMLAGPSYGQTSQSQPVPDVLEKLKPDTDESMHYVEAVAHAGRIDAIPILENKFVHTQDPVDKAKIAGVLVRLGDKNDTYWDFLAGVVTVAVDSDAPDVADSDAQGKSLPGLSPKFIAWAKAHNIPPAEAASNATYVLPAEVMMLGDTRDRRAIPLLRRALHSPNYLIVSAAADGLAEIGDEASVPLIISACKDAPVDARGAIAESLVYFDDAQAQKIVDKFVPKEIAETRRKERASGKKGPFDY